MMNQMINVTIKGETWMEVARNTLPSELEGKLEIITSKKTLEYDHRPSLDELKQLHLDHGDYKIKYSTHNYK